MANRRGKVKSVTDFIFLGSKLTVAADCSHKIKRCLLLGRKAMTNLDSLLKSRDITLLTKACIVKLWFFQESCTYVRLGPQKMLSAEELMLSNCGAGGLLRVPLIKEIKPVNPIGDQP